jgi:3-oxoacyl-[acyl-carrier-protein] synthase II
VRRRVVVTGVGCITPVGNNVGTAWNSICNGQSGIDTITSFDPSILDTRFAGEVKGFDPIAAFGRKDSRRMDRYTQFAIAATQEAIRNANLEINPTNRDRIGVFIGTGIGGMGSFVHEVEVFRTHGPKRVSPFMVPMMLPDSAGGQVAIFTGARGPNLAVVSACATGSNAVGEAAEVIRRGAADAMIAGGAESALLPVVMAGFSVMGALSQRNDDPQRASRPFDKDRDGFVAGEGSGIVILEEYEFARARNAPILAEFLGYATTDDAFHISAPAGDGAGAAVCIRNAILDAGISTAAVDYVNAHGTSTHLNDKSETAALKTVLKEHAYKVNISSTKSMTGHLLGAAGGIEAIFSVLAIHHGKIPPTINYTTPDPDCDLNYTPNKAIQKEVRVAMSNSFGFGGHNACVIFGKSPESK